MTSRFVLAGLVCFTLSGCMFYAPSDGNPDGDAYVGSRGGTYEAAVNPQRTIGEVSYNPAAPLPENPSATSSSGSAMMAFPSPMSAPPKSPR